MTGFCGASAAGSSATAAAAPASRPAAVAKPTGSSMFSSRTLLAPAPAASPFGSRSGAGRQAAAALTRRELMAGTAAAAALLPPALAAQAAPGAAAAAGSVATAAAASAAADATAAQVQLGELKTEVDGNGVQRLALQPEGWNTWTWRGHNVNWLQAGTSGPVVLLIHGFGASVYHWRYTVPELSKTCRVYALDCLGFGWSSKPVVEYEGYGLWSDQISDFIREVIGEGQRAVLVGNSLGGYNAVATAARSPELVRGVVLLNAAGRFEEATEGQAEEAAAGQQQGVWDDLVSRIGTAIKRAVVFASFVFTKQPARIRQVLGQVYVSDRNIDEDLVRSISLPAQDPNAPEVFYRIITARGEAMNRLLDKMQDGGNIPLYLLWGEKDPWCVPARATQIQKYYPAAERTDLLSGHCPMDDTPELVNRELARWVAQLPPEAGTA